MVIHSYLALTLWQQDKASIIGPEFSACGSGLKRNVGALSHCLSFKLSFWFQAIA